MRKLITTALVASATILLLPTTSTASNNQAIQEEKNKISTPDQSKDKILISETRDGDVMREETPFLRK